MRIDKFLKISRIIKRRSIAKELADQQRILLNGKIAKASNDVKIDDEILIIFGNKKLTVKVNEIKEQANKETAKLLFEIMKEEKLND